MPNRNSRHSDVCAVLACDLQRLIILLQRRLIFCRIFTKNQISNSLDS